MTVKVELLFCNDKKEPPNGIVCEITLYIDESNLFLKRKLIEDHISYAYKMFEDITKINISEEKYNI
jgi:hypothetical protein